MGKNTRNDAITFFLAPCSENRGVRAWMKVTEASTTISCGRMSDYITRYCGRGFSWGYPREPLILQAEREVERDRLG